MTAYMDWYISPYATLLIPLLLAWRVFCIRKYRFCRVQELETQYRHLQDKLENMSYQEANEIMKLALYWDMPWSSVVGLSMGSFKAFAIPTMSDVMLKSEALRSAVHAKRHTELETIFIFDMITEGLDSIRGSTALTRMNYLHSRYSKVIRNEDMLFALALFIFEPVDWAAKYEWRAPRELEIQARYVFWREIGARMGIQGIPRTKEALHDWMKEHAKDNMVCTQSTQRLGYATLDALLPACPQSLKNILKRFMTCLLDARTRLAFGWSAQESGWLIWPINTLLHARALFIGYLCMPRNTMPSFLQSAEVLHMDGVSGKQEIRIVRGDSFLAPYFRAGSKAEYSPEGYSSSSLGPAKLSDTGIEATLREARNIRERAMLCPFFG